MISKIWKKVAFVVLILACLFNITYKVVKKLPVLQELQQTVAYSNEQQNTVENTTEKTNNVTTTTKSTAKNSVSNSNTAVNSVIDLLK